MAMIEDMTPLRALSVGGPELSGAIEILRRYSDQDLTLTDAVGLHLLSELGLRHCWSTDFHLGLSGVTLVVHEH